MSPLEVARRARAPKGQGDRLREEILEAAGRLLAETGDESKVSIRAVAEAVGVTPPSIYLHFPDRDALVTEVCNVRFAVFDAALMAAAARHDAPLDRLRACGRAYVKFGLANPEHYRLLFLTRSDRLKDMHNTEHAGAVAFAHLVAAVQACIDAGHFAASDPVRVAILLWTGLHGLVSLLITEPGFPWPPVEALVDDLLKMQTRGLAP